MKKVEETIKQLELILKVRKEQKEIIECAGGSCMNCDPDIKALTESIDILSDYKRVLKENEELKDYKLRTEYTKKLCKSKVEEAEKKLEKMKNKIEDIIVEIQADKLNYSEDDWYLESEVKGYAIDKLKEIESEVK